MGREAALRAWPELRAEFRADVGRADVEAQHLCSPTGTDRSADEGGYAVSMESRRQRGEAVGGGSEGAGAASCFPGMINALAKIGQAKTKKEKGALTKELLKRFPQLK